MQSARMRSPSIRWRCKRRRLVLRKPQAIWVTHRSSRSSSSSSNHTTTSSADSPKFPQPEIHEFLLAEWRLWGTTRLYDMTARTMLAMSRGGMYDHVEGGF